MKSIRFRFSAEKARAALHWMIERRPGIDLHALLKACYFADKRHLNEHGRPIFGATYRAMRFGPVPMEIYEMLKGEAIWLAELGAERYPWRMEGYRLRLAENDETELGSLSKSDLEALEDGFARSLELTLDERTAATHGSDWQAANLGVMQYENMLEDSPRKEDLVAYLREASRHIKL